MSAMAVAVKRTVALNPSPLTGREGGQCIAPERGNPPRGGGTIISGFLGFCTIVGAVVGTVSLVLYLYDRKKK